MSTNDYTIETVTANDGNTFHIGLAKNPFYPRGHTRYGKFWIFVDKYSKYLHADGSIQGKEFWYDSLSEVMKAIDAYNQSMKPKVGWDWIHSQEPGSVWKCEFPDGDVRKYIIFKSIFKPSGNVLLDANKYISELSEYGPRGIMVSDIPKLSDETCERIE